ncbi:DNA methyltransferase [Peribacillus deserti]|uniref:DNA methyltransferase n=2 Tax=Peribacillus deserti TaxID=673318 RepID=A0A2N5M8I3_9BACI|nr:DNA methyltransferase [Peribacillus deserti]
MRAISIIVGIPPGKVMAYGQIARLSGSPRGARQVVRILHSMSEKYELPWHRVVNAKGEIAFRSEDGADEQKERLQAEGIIIQDNKVNLDEYLYHPEIDLIMMEGE